MSEPTDTPPPSEFQVGDCVVIDYSPNAKRVVAVTPNGNVIVVDSVGPMLIPPDRQHLLRKVSVPTA